MMAQLVKPQERTVGYPLLVQADDPPGYRFALEAFRQKRHELGAMLAPERIGCETQVRNQLGEVESAAEAGPLLVTLDTDRQVPTIRALKRLMWCGGGSGAAEPVRLFAGG